MILLILITIIVIVALIWSCGEILFPIVMGGMSFLVAFLVLLIPHMIIADNLVDNPKAVVEHEEIEICAIKDNITGSGSFFLGSGTYSKDPAYFYMVKSQHGKQMEHIEANNYVYVDDSLSNGETPYLDVISYTSDSWWINNLFMWPEANIYIFHVPEDSITTEFEIDME